MAEKSHIGLFLGGGVIKDIGVPVYLLPVAVGHIYTFSRKGDCTLKRIQRVVVVISADLKQRLSKLAQRRGVLGAVAKVYYTVYPRKIFFVRSSISDTRSWLSEKTMAFISNLLFKYGDHFS